MNSVKTLWENNKTVVDAENLNKIEDELYNLTVATVSANRDIDNIKESTLACYPPKRLML